MSAQAPSSGPRQHGLLRWTILCALVAAPVAALAIAAVNLLQASDLDDIAAAQEQTVAQLERRVHAAAASGAPKVDASAIYLAGATPSLARAGLQRLMIDAVERASGRVIEAQDAAADDGPDSANDGRVRLRVTFDARNAALLDIVHGVETGLPLLTVEKIEIRRLEAGADADPEDPMLRVGLVVVGVARLVAG